MAIEMRKGWDMTPEQSTAIYGHPVNVLNKYRVLGTPVADASSAYGTHLRTGQIWGSPVFGGDAYFSHGQIHGTYYGDALDSGLNRNFVYEMTPEFDTKNNKLYYNELERATKGGGGPKLNWDRPARAEYGSISPRENTSFWNRVNQRGSHAGVRGGEFVSGVFSNPKLGFKTGTPNIDWKFDYTKPFFQTSIPTHAKNAEHVARVVLAQPETKAVLNAAGNASMKAGATAGFLIDVPEQMYLANKRRREKDGPQEATASEIASMLGLSTAKSVANAVTLGAALSGTGKDRPSRGPARMEDSSTEAYRRMIDKAKNWKLVLPE